MSRAVAAALAVFATLTIFGLAFVAVGWFFGARSFVGALNIRWFPAVLIAFNGLVTGLLVMVLAVRRKRMEGDSEPKKPGLMSASERFREEVRRKD